MITALFAKFRSRSIAAAGDSLSFASPKESKPRKGDPQSGSLRFATGTLRCSKQAGSRANSPAAQTSTSPDPLASPLLSPARTGGGRDLNSGSIEPAARAQWRYVFNSCLRTYSLGYRPKYQRNCIRPFKLPQRCIYPDQLTNFTGFRGSFVTVKICSTFSRSPIHTRLAEEFDDQIKLQRPH